MIFRAPSMWRHSLASSAWPFFFAGQRILGRMGDGHRAMPLKHLPGDDVDLGFGNHGVLLIFPN